MALLKRKAEKSTVIAVRVPVSIKNDIAGLKAIADSRGFDITGSLSDALVKWVKQISEELTTDTRQNAQSSNNHRSHEA